ncbi:hypothetical protein RRG08_062567 [Elysia crispata]|uniref:Ig-like domain-containing protein n=1 Tax=Elysia crispata TaxID=231223 RepID=A0AAE1E114_9GAST|nr:hypothetical protein RRG08_062567 [Elysia crispata]
MPFFFASSALPSKGPEELNEISPSFLPRPSVLRFYRGDTAVLVCGVDNLGTKTVTWRRSSDPNPLTIGEDVYVGDSRYSASKRPAEKEWILAIADVQIADAGVYECQISSKTKLIFHILLHVNDTENPQRKNYVNFKKDRVPPVKNPGISLAGTKFVEKGDPIHLVCNSTGRMSSPHNLDWFKDGVKLLPSGLRKIKIDKFHVPHSLTLVSVLDIRHSQMEDAGTYVCRSSDLSIISTKVHVLNAGSTNVRRTSATDETSEPEAVDQGVDDGTQQQQQRPPQNSGISPHAMNLFNREIPSISATLHLFLPFLLTFRLWAVSCSMAQGESRMKHSLCNLLRKVLKTPVTTPNGAIQLIAYLRLLADCSEIEPKETTLTSAPTTVNDEHEFEQESKCHNPIGEWSAKCVFHNEKVGASLSYLFSWREGIHRKTLACSKVNTHGSNVSGRSPGINDVAQSEMFDNIKKARVLELR